MTTELVDTSTWVLTNANDNEYGAIVKGAPWCVKTAYGKAGTSIAWGWNPYGAWYQSFLKAGYSKYMAHDLALEKCGVPQKD